MYLPPDDLVTFTHGGKLQKGYLQTDRHQDNDGTQLCLVEVIGDDLAAGEAFKWVKKPFDCNVDSLYVGQEKTLEDQLAEKTKTLAGDSYKRFMFHYKRGGNSREVTELLEKLARETLDLGGSSYETMLFLPLNNQKQQLLTDN